MFQVEYRTNDEWIYICDVKAVDSNTEKFLVVIDNEFRWVPMSQCRPY